MRSGILLSTLAILGHFLVACFAASGRNEHKVIGTIESINTDCWVDAICSMKISGDVIVFGAGRSPEIYGELIGFNERLLGDSTYIGKKVEVFGKKVGDGTSIEGSKKYYIKLLE